MSFSVAVSVGVSPIYALKVWNGNLVYITGTYSNYVNRWDGVSATNIGYFASTAISDLIVFDGDLYALHSTVTNFYIDKYSGSGTTWTNVFSTAISCGIYTAQRGCINYPDTLAFSAEGCGIYSSSDGSSWSTDIVPSNFRRVAGIESPFSTIDGTYVPAYITGTADSTGYYKVSGGTWSAAWLESGTLSIVYTRGRCSPGLYAYDSSDNYIYESTDDGNTWESIDLNGDSIYSYCYNTFKYVFTPVDIGSSYNIYVRNPGLGTWALYDNLPSTATVMDVVILDNKVYLTAGSSIWVSEEALPGEIILAILPDDPPYNTVIGRKSPSKISVDRNSGAIYCSAFDVSSFSTVYYKVTADLSAVTTILTSTASGYYGGVHSAESSGVYAFGNIDGILLKRSDDGGSTFLSYDSGVGTFMAGFYTGRDYNLPTYLLGITTLSGATSDAYNITRPGVWTYLSNTGEYVTMLVVASGSALAGAYAPMNANILIESTTDGSTWSGKDGGLPDITITDIEFA